MPSFSPESRARMYSQFLRDVRSPSGRVTGTSAGRITGTAADMESVFGTADEFMASYEQVHAFYKSFLNNPDNLSRRPGTEKAVETARRTGRMDLDVLNYASRRRIQDMAYETLNLNKVMHTFGMPGIDLPSSNPYRHLTKFDVDMSDSGAMHPAKLLLNSMYFNIDPNANLTDAISKSLTNLMSPTELRSAMNQVNPDGTLSPYGRAPGAGEAPKRILVLDTETTGVSGQSRVRSYAAREATLQSDGSMTMMSDSTARRMFFRQPGMEGGLIQTPSGERSLSVGANMMEMRATDTMIDVVADPTAARNAMVQELEHMLSFDRIAIKNARFDVRMLIRTAEGMPGFEGDDQLQDVVRRFTERAYQDPEFVTDIDFSLRQHMSKVFDNEANRYITAARADMSSPEAQQLLRMGIGEDVLDGTLTGPGDIASFEAEARNFLYSRKMVHQSILEKSEQIGGAFTPAAADNIGLNTNLFELIYKEAADGGPDARAAKDLMNMMTQGSHIAETDVPLAHFIGKYVQTGQLSFRPENLDHLPVSQRAKAKEFIDFASTRISKSSAPTMTTNIASVEQLTRKTLNQLRTNEGQKLFSVKANITDVMSARAIADLSTELGGVDVSGMSGVVRYDKNTQGFKFFTSDERAIGGGADRFSRGFDINETRARRYISTTLNQALDGSTNRRVTFGVAGVNSAVVNEASDKISIGLNYGQMGMIGRYDSAITAVAQAIDADMLKDSIKTMDERSLVESLTATARMKAPSIAPHEAIRGAATGTSPSTLDHAFGGIVRKATEERTLEAYSRTAAAIGNPYADTDIMHRALSTELSTSTARAAKDAYAAVGDAAGRSFTGTSSLRFLKNADVLTEFGFQTFKSQGILKVVNDTGDGLVSSKILANEEIFERMKVRVASAPGSTEPFENVSLIKAMTDENYAAREILDESGSKIALGAEFNKVRMSSVAGDNPIVNAFIGGQGVHTRSMSQTLAESLYDAMDSYLAEVDTTDEAIEAATGDTKRALTEVKRAKAHFSAMGREEAVNALGEKIHTSGLGFSRLGGDDAAGYLDILERTGNISGEGSDEILQSGLTARIVGKTNAAEGGGSFVVSQFEDSKASALARGLSEEQEAVRAVQSDTKAKEIAGTISDHLDDNRSLRNSILAETESLKYGSDVAARAAKARAMYQKYKKPAGLAGLGVAAAGLGYYMYKQIKEDDQYDEVIDPMPTDPARAPRQDIYREDFMSGQNFTVTADPLATAGIVGNLDRNKINHTQMGSNKYNYLYS